MPWQNSSKGSVEDATNGAAQAISGISRTIATISEVATSTASAIEEQGAATAEIARNVQEASSGTASVSANIGGVSEAAAETGAAASQVLGSSGELARQLELLRQEVETFLSGIRAARPASLLRSQSQTQRGTSSPSRQTSSNGVCA